MSVQAMKAGAIDFLTKPVDAQVLLAAIERAQNEDAKKRELHDARATIEANLAKLTPREREVLTHVIAGRLNKQIASDLGTVEKTIKVHRGRMMGKMGVQSVAELVRIAERAGVEPHPHESRAPAGQGVAFPATSPAGPFGSILAAMGIADMDEPAIRLAVVDDDASVRKALARLLNVAPFVTATFGSAQDFLDSLPLNIPDCLVLDLQMPEMTGLDLQEQLARIGIQIPTIIVTAHDENN